MKRVTPTQARIVGAKLGVDFRQYDLKEFHQGMNVEMEHRDVTGGNLILTGKIAYAHLRELPDYYSRLREMEKAR